MTLTIQRLMLAAALAFGLATIGTALAGSAASPFGLTGVAFAQEGDDDGGDDDGSDDDGRPQGGVDTGAGGAVFPFQVPDDDGGDDDADDNGGRGDDDDGRPQGGVDTGAGGMAGADGSGPGADGNSMIPLAATGLAATLVGGGLLARRKLAAER